MTALQIYDALTKYQQEHGLLATERLLREWMRTGGGK